MDNQQVIELFQGALWMVLLICTPVLLSSLVVGVLISIFQATTSIQEQTLSFLPKMLTILAVLLYFGYFVADQMRTYTIDLFSKIAEAVG